MRKLLVILLAAPLFAQNPVTSPFPTSLDNDLTLTVEKNNVTSALSADITNSTLSIPVAAGTGSRFLVGQIITIGFNALGEKCQITSISGDTLTVTSRGAFGTTAVSAVLGTLVSQFHEARTTQALGAAVKAIETALGAGLSNVSGGGGGGATFSVKDYGAAGNAKSFVNGSMSASSLVLTDSTNSPFVSGDVGKLIQVIGACRNSSVNSTFSGTITGYTSASSVTLTLGSGVSCASMPGGTGLTYAYGTNDTTAVASALTGVCAVGGGTLLFPSKTGGYMVAPSNYAAAIPAGITVPCSNVTLQGDASLTNIYANGAWHLVSAAVVRGAGIVINGFSHVTVANLWVHGMTNGNSATVSLSTSTGDGWDISHKGIEIYPNTTNAYIIIRDNWVTDFKGEDIYSGGSSNSNFTILRNHLSNSNADGISISASSSQIVGNYLASHANACIENGIFSTDGDHLVFDNQCFDGLSNGYSFVAADNNSSSSTRLAISRNIARRVGIGSISAGGASGVTVGVQTGSTGAISGVSITDNEFTDTLNGVTLESANGCVVTGNKFVIDTHNLTAPFNFVRQGIPALNHITNCRISNNDAYPTAGAVSGSFQWNEAGLIIGPSNVGTSYYPTVTFTNVVMEENSFKATSTMGYFYQGSGGTPWTDSLLSKNINFRNNICSGCVFTNAEGQLTISTGSPLIYPYFDQIQVTSAAPVAGATVASNKSEDGQHVTITNISTNAVAFASDTHIILPSALTLGLNDFVTFRYNGTLSKWVYLTSSVPPAGGSGSSAFNAVTTGTNTTATMACGTGCVMGPTGTGALVANHLQNAGSGALPIPALSSGALTYIGSALAWVPVSGSGRLQVTTSGTTLTVTCASGPCVVGPIGNPVSPTYASFATGTYSCTALTQPSGTTADVFVSSSGTLSINTDGIVPATCSGIAIASTGGLAAFPGGSWIARATATSSTWDTGGVTMKAGSTPGAPVYNFQGALVSDGSGNVSFIGKVPVLTSTSGPVADPTGDYYYLVNNASGALTYNLPVGVTGMQRCYRNSTGKTGVITVAVTTSNIIDLAGVASTTSTGSITSGGALGDSVCLWSDAANHWMAQVGLGTWTAH